MIQIKKTFNIPRARLWKALTNHKQMQQWYFKELGAFDAKVGFQTSFSIEYQGKIFTHQWRVCEVIPKKRIVYHWQYKEYDGDSTVFFELEDTNNGVDLLLKAKILKPFPPIEEFSPESRKAGWQSLIEDRLTTFLKQ